ncbi:hypothetical protein [Succinivibrio dextrinosolvens]|nr:hypothetical protein [Succinivibrio dextrinosolvens]
MLKKDSRSHEVHSVHTINATIKLFDLKEGMHRINYDKPDEKYGAK